MVQTLDRMICPIYEVEGVANRLSFVVIDVQGKRLEYYTTGQVDNKRLEHFHTVCLSYAILSQRSSDTMMAFKCYMNWLELKWDKHATSEQEKFPRNEWSTSIRVCQVGYSRLRDHSLLSPKF